MADHNHLSFNEQYVHRPSGFWTANVHSLLRYLHAEKFTAIPLPIGFDKQGREIVTYMKGATGEFPFDEHLKSVTALVSAAKLLRQFHDFSTGFLVSQNIDHSLWQLESKTPFEVICHGDFAPYNVVYEREKVTGIIDFDCAHPGPRAWDLAYALYRWAPLSNPDNQDGFGTLDEQLKRAKLFIDAYNLEAQDKADLAELIIERLAALIDFMFTQAGIGNQIHKINIENGHHLQYQADIAYIKANKLKIQQFLIN